MIKFYTAFTEEIDDPQMAAEEIIEQLNPSENMRKNTIGIVHFHYDFAEESIWRQFAEALPFELAGCMSVYIGAGGQYSDTAVSVTMLTSDDVSFTVKTIDHIASKATAEINSELEALLRDLSAEKKPKLIIPFLSSTPSYTVNDLYDSANAIDSQIRLFGMQAFSIDGRLNSAFILGNEKMSSDMCALIAFYGNIEPQFHINTSLFYDETFGEEAVITDAERVVLKSVNGIPALEYFKKQGLISSENIDTGAGVMSVPAIIKYTNGTKGMCAFLGVVKDTEYLFAARALEPGAKIVFSHIDSEKTLESAKSMINEICETKENNLIIFSSASRAWASPNVFAEMQKIAESAKSYEEENGKPLEYSIAYTGGEICPYIAAEGEDYMNMIHNYTLSVCAFS
ncbi:MAG: hypothetical protein FWG90_02195 [Oscillospiraceae bacterium]|nr:hypothetical protein [Oscillospiraceae bacterium]